MIYPTSRSNRRIQNPSIGQETVPCRLSPLSFCLAKVSKTVNTDDWDDDELVLRLKTGEQEAYRNLVRQYQKRLFSIAYGITLDPEDSAEIVQEVFLKVYQRIHTFKGESKLFTWLRRITVNQSLNWQRRWRRRFRWHHQSLEKDDNYDSVSLSTNADSPERAYLQQESNAILNEGLKTLPEDARTVFMLKEIEGLSYDEIGTILGIKKGTVSSRIFYARKKLKENLSALLKQEENS